MVSARTEMGKIGFKLKLTCAGTVKPFEIAGGPV